MSLPRVLFCKSSKMFQSPEWTSRRVLSWDEGWEGEVRGEGNGDLFATAAEAVRDREKCRKGGLQLAPRTPPNRS